MNETKGILRRHLLRSHIVNIEMMPSSNIVYIDVKIAKLYQVGVRTPCRVEGLRDNEVELRLVPNLGPLHAADAPLQDRHPSHCDSISIKLVQAGEYQNQVGAGTVMVLHDHLHNTRTLRIANKFQSQSGFQLKNLSSYHTCFVSWQFQNLLISGLMVL